MFNQYESMFKYLHLQTVHIIASSKISIFLLITDSDVKGVHKIENNYRSPWASPFQYFWYKISQEASHGSREQDIASNTANSCVTLKYRIAKSCS